MDGLATPPAEAAEKDLSGGARRAEGDTARGAPIGGTAGGGAREAGPPGPGARDAGTRGAAEAESGCPFVERPPTLAALAGTAFCKMSGGGNDFVVFDDRAGSFPKGQREVVRALCARGIGVGADAVLLLERPEDPTADFRMAYYNADGGEAPMCGNGALCIARFARELGLGKEGAVEFETGAGRYHAELVEGAPSRVRLAMRDPSGIRPSIPEIESRGYARAGFVDTGTPHLVLLVPDLAAVDVAGEGAALRRHPLFQPDGLNVSFVAVLGRAELAIRTYERGVEAETLSCGTGATAAALLTHLWGLTQPPVVVLPPGGFDLTVRFAVDGAVPPAFRDVTLEGDARIVFRGTLGSASRGTW